MGRWDRLVVVGWDGRGDGRGDGMGWHGMEWLVKGWHRVQLWRTGCAIRSHPSHSADPTPIPSRAPSRAPSETPFDPDPHPDPHPDPDPDPYQIPTRITIPIPIPIPIPRVSPCCPGSSFLSRCPPAPPPPLHSRCRRPPPSARPTRQASPLRLPPYLLLRSPLRPCQQQTTRAPQGLGRLYSRGSPTETSGCSHPLPPHPLPPHPLPPHPLRSLRPPSHRR